MGRHTSDQIASRSLPPPGRRIRGPCDRRDRPDPHHPQEVVERRQLRAIDSWHDSSYQNKMSASALTHSATTTTKVLYHIKLISMRGASCGGKHTLYPTPRPVFLSRCWRNYRSWRNYRCRRNYRCWGRYRCWGNCRRSAVSRKP